MDPSSPNTSSPTRTDHQSTCQQIEGQLKRLLGIQQRSETTARQQNQWARQDQEYYDRLFVRDPPEWTTWPTARAFRELYEEQHHDYSHTREFALMADAFDEFEARMDPKEDTTDDKTVVDNQDYDDIDDPELDDPDCDNYLYPPALDFKNPQQPIALFGSVSKKASRCTTKEVSKQRVYRLPCLTLDSLFKRIIMLPSQQGAKKTRAEVALGVCRSFGIGLRTAECRSPGPSSG
eukprot:g31865.t1